MTDAFGMRREYRELLQNHPGIATALAESLTNVAILGQPSRLKIDEFLSSLPKLTEQDIVTSELTDASCPICITPFLALLAEEEMAVAMESPAHHTEELGVTKLQNKCGHVFCRKDIQNWLRGGHNSCPTCRRTLVDVAAQTTPFNVQPPAVAEMIAMLGRVDPFDPVGARDLYEVIDVDVDQVPEADDLFANTDIRLQAQPAPGQGEEHDDRHEFTSMYS
ncbi:unnamed protein product [Somion occarium]|uniref:RING-type domain-containing protein n=2 Tax=Somion occarium TaxID=3059160 RepID=A0ABP1DZ29_9APHY